MSTHTTCCIVGGGPAGMMLGYLLARRGVQTTVIEKHKDFFRDFRGDTVHPSTLDVIDELGLLDEFLKVPHQKLTSISGKVGDLSFDAADFRFVPTRCKFVALMPQWDFLNFLASHARQFSSFNLQMEHEAVDIIQEAGRVVGVKVRTPDGETEIRADLIVACDGRHSTLRSAADLRVIEIGVPIDVLWFRISRHANDPEQLLGNVNYGAALILINRGDYFQSGLIIRKGSFEDIRRDGLPSFQQQLRRIAPYLGDRVEEVHDWDQVKLLSVQINRLEPWHRPGLLCIGDAAHAMSPAGGVGINLAIQDAIAAANALAGPLNENAVTELLLAQIQRRREFPARVTQFVQARAHQGFEVVLRDNRRLTAPWQLRAVTSIPLLKYAIARLVGVGVRPEHVMGVERPEARRRLVLRLAVCAGIAIAMATVKTAKRTRTA